MRHGHGTHGYNDERKYEGLWMNDKRHGAPVSLPSAC